MKEMCLVENGWTLKDSSQGLYDINLSTLFSEKIKIPTLQNKTTMSPERHAVKVGTTKWRLPQEMESVEQDQKQWHNWL